MQYETTATAMVKRYSHQMALSTRKADAWQATVPLLRGLPDKEATINEKNTTLRFNEQSSAFGMARST